MTGDTLGIDMNRQKILRLLTFHFSLFAFLLSAFSQEQFADSCDLTSSQSALRNPLNKEVLHSTTFGYFGTASAFDSYLMPYEYCDGVDFRVQRETARMTNLLNSRISNQTFVDVNFAGDLMTDGGPSWYAGGIRYSQGWLYNFRDCNVVNPAERTTRKWNYAAGLQVSGYLGGVYIDRDGNNPGQAKADVMLNVTGIISYAFRFKRHRPLVLSYQLTFPLLGVAFSPNYGQSYYEIFELKNYDHNVVFANTFNMPSNRHRVILDMPIGNSVLRIGYDLQVNQASLNKLKYNSTTMDFMIGFTKYFYRK